MKPLVIIPARAGSKSVPNKNTKLLGGKPLIQYTIEEAIKAFPKNLISVSTDDANVIEICKKFELDIPFIRPAELAQDNSSMQEVLIHALQHHENLGLDIDTLVLLQPTSPFRNAYHIKEAVELLRPNLDMIASVKVTSSNPYFVLFEEDSTGLLQKSKSGNFTRRQDCPNVYELNGAIFVINAKSLKETTISKFKHVGKYLMNELDSLDIDNEIDWLLAEVLTQIKK